MDHETWSIDRARSIIGPDSSSNDIIAIVLANLPLNIKQEMIVCKIMRYTICNQVTP